MMMMAAPPAAPAMAAPEPPAEPPPPPDRPPPPGPPPRFWGGLGGCKLHVSDLFVVQVSQGCMGSSSSISSSPDATPEPVLFAGFVAQHGTGVDSEKASLHFTSDAGASA